MPTKTTLSAAVVSWAESRGLSLGTLQKLGVASGQRGFVEIEWRKVDAIGFVYRRGPKVVNIKYRAVEDKYLNQMSEGEQRFWNLDAVLNSEKDWCYIFEGEPDVCAAVEAGIAVDEVLSVPNGAPEAPVEDPAASDKYRYVETALQEGLSKKKRFILAVDNDEKGEALKADLMKLLGPARCWELPWPKAIKDANDMLMKWGRGDTLDFLEGDARPVRVPGIYTLDEFPEEKPLRPWTPPYPYWNGRLQFAAGTLVAVTGHPGHGKSTIMTHIAWHHCKWNGIKAAIASMETRVKPHHRRTLRQCCLEKPENEMTDEEIAQADKVINERVYWISHPDRRPTFGWLMEMLEVAVIRHGVKFILIDPWNKIQRDIPFGVKETDWIRDRLNELLNFAQDNDVCVIVIAHPSKSNEGRNRKTPPILEDIAGSKAWDDVVDQGLTIWRDSLFHGDERQTDASVLHLKARYEELGYPCRLEVNYSLTKRVYNHISPEEAREIRRRRNGTKKADAAIRYAANEDSEEEAA